MKNKDKKQSTQLWAHRLFRQAGAAISTSQSKSYYVRSYGNHCCAQTQNPFSALFSGDENKASLKTFEENRFFHSDNLTGAIDAVITEGSIRQTAASLQFNVLNSYNETWDTKTFRLGKREGQHFNYLPGQYVTLAVAIGNQIYKRSYSLASSSSHHGVIEITVKRDPNGGLVSNWLNDQLKPGDTVNLKGPYGAFSCVTNNSKKILFLAAGSGVVPIMSMLRWLADTEAQADVELILSFRTDGDIIYHDELKLIAARHRNIKLFINLTQKQLNDNENRQFSGRINKTLIATRIPDLMERMVYLCGPESFMADCKSYLKELGFPDGQIYFESFTVNSPAALIQQSRRKTGSYQITFAKSRKTVLAEGELSVLELAEKSGIAIEHECRSGTCGECMVRCLEGKIKMTGQAEIDDSDRRKGWVYSCCAYPISNAVLDA